MVKIEYEDFMRLSEKEKCIRYKDMSDYDRFRARVSHLLIYSKSIGHIKLSKEQKLKGKEMIEEVIKMVEISRKSND